MFQWLAKQLYPHLGAESAYAQIARDAERSPLGANGLTLLPHFQGTAAPYWQPRARGLLYNLTLGTSRGEIARAFLEGVCLEIANNLSVLEEIAGTIATLKSAGGLNRIALFLRILADATNKAVHIYPTPNASALGALISCGVNQGVFASYEKAFEEISIHEVAPVMPHRDNTREYRKLLQSRQELFDALQRVVNK